MRTTDLVAWLLSLLAGAALGAFYFGGLWWTVRAIVGSPRSVFVQLGSLLIRTATTLAGFWLVGGGDFKRLVACLVGFVLARAVVTRWVRTSAMPSPIAEA